MRRSNPVSVTAVALAVLTAACTGGSVDTTVPPSQPAAASVTTEQSAPPDPDLTTPVMVYPDRGSLIDTSVWGEVPANLVDVLLSDGAGMAEAERVASALGGDVVGSIDLISYFQIEIDSTSEQDLTSAIELALTQAGVEEAFPELAMAEAAEASCSAQGPLQDSWFTASQDAADPQPYNMIGLEQAWAAVRAGGVTLTPVKVGVVDTALYSGSPELAGASRITGASRWDTTNQPSLNADGSPHFGGMTHATGVAHVIAADPANGGMVGVASVMGDNLSVSVTDVFTGNELFMPVKANPSDLTQVTLADGAWASTTLTGIISQINQGATVINLSIGAKQPGEAYRPYSVAYRRLFESLARSHPKVVFVAAAGNKTTGLDGYNNAPGGLSLPNVITVGAVDSTGTASNFTNYAAEGGEVTIAAPGVGVPMGIGPDGKPFHANGTSFSAPMVAGAVALLQSLDPDLTASQIKDILRATGSKTVKGDREVTIPDDLGGRLLRVDQAVLRVINERRAAGDTPRPPLEWAQIAALTGLTATAETAEGDTYTVTGQIAGVGDDGTDLSVTLLSEGSVAGDPVQRLEAPGSALWLVVLDQSPGAVAVQRADTGVGCNLSLESARIDGLWTGSMVLTSVEFLSDEIEVAVDDGEPIVMSVEECQALLASDEAKEPIPIQYNFATTSPGAGTVTGTASDGGTDQPVSGSWIGAGDTVTFEMGVPGQSAVTFEGSVGETTMEGTWESSDEDMVISGTFTMTRSAGK